MEARVLNQRTKLFLSLLAVIAVAVMIFFFSAQQGNDSSKHVMEKLGMEFEGFARDSMLVKGKYRTIGVCSIINESS